jgi:ABC-type glycerol-3-phosphate transport system substrate-binding protein
MHKEDRTMGVKSLRSNALVFVSIIAILTGCCATPTATPSPEPITIKFWDSWGGAIGDFFEEEADVFHDQYPWVTVEVSHFPDRTAYLEALALAFESDSAPDAFIRGGHKFKTLIENEWIQPLDPWITSEWKARFPDGSFVETRTVWQGKIYSFPSSLTPTWDKMLYVNEDLFRAAELVDADGNIQTPKTWGDLRSMAAQITEVGDGEFYGIGIGIKDPRPMSWWFDLACLGGTSTTPYDYDFRTGQYVYSTHPAYAQIVELLLGMKEDGSVYPYEGSIDDGNIYSFFGEGKYAMFMSGSYAISNLQRDFPDFENYQVIPLPVPDEGQAGDMVVVPPKGNFYISSQTQHPDEAWLWMDWLASRGYHERMVKKGLGFSIYADLNVPENITDGHRLQAYAVQTTYGAFGPFPPGRNPDTALVRPEPCEPDVGDLLIGIYTGQVEDWQQALVDLDACKQAALESAIQEARDAGADISLEDFIFTDWNPLEGYVTELEE